MVITVVIVITNNSVALTYVPGPVLSTLRRLFHLILTSAARGIL